MKPVDFKDTSDYQYMEILGVEGVFSNLRIQKDSLPTSFHKYSLRAGEGESFSQVSDDVLIDHAGDFIAKSPLNLDPDNSQYLNDDDWRFIDKPFVFEEFFGVKRSLACQIADATAKRDAQAGDPKSKTQVKSNPLENEIH